MITLVLALALTLIIAAYVYSVHQYEKHFADQAEKQREFALSTLSYIKAESATDKAQADGLRDKLAIENEALKAALRRIQERSQPADEPDEMKGLIRTKDGRILEPVTPEDLL